MVIKNILSSDNLDMYVGSKCVVVPSNISIYDTRNQIVERVLSESNIWTVTSIRIIEKPTKKHEYIREAIEVEVENVGLNKERFYNEFCGRVDIYDIKVCLNILKSYKKYISESIKICNRYI